MLATLDPDALNLQVLKYLLFALLKRVSTTYSICLQDHLRLKDWQMRNPKQYIYNLEKGLATVKTEYDNCNQNIK